MFRGPMLRRAKITRISNSSAAAQTEVVSDVLDMAGYDSVMIIATLGDVTSTSVLTLTVKENTANSTSSPTPSTVTDATCTFTAGATDADNKLMIVDVIRPSKRYVFASLTRTTANAVVDSITAIQYNSRSVDVSQGSTVLKSALSTPEA
jgi:hypothetical protein